MAEDRGPALAERVAALLAASGLPGRVEGLHRLSGGASRETWALDLVAGDVGRPLILQRSRAGAVGTGPGMTGEAVLIRAAAAAGVAVPNVVLDDPGDALGSPCIVMDRLDGETIARKVLRDPPWADARTRLVAQAAAAMAAIHRIPLEEAPPLPDADQLDAMRALLHDFDEPHPALELAIRWLERNRPAASARCVVHGDFRLGNLLVDPDGLAGVLDWELAHVGDPAEDLGWYCVRAWRFGSPLPAGGMGTREELLAAYEAAGGAPIDAPRLLWWEVLGTLKWAVICVVQAQAHLGGAVRSVELATIGRRVCESAWDVLGLLPGGPMPGPSTPPAEPPRSLHGRPTAGELVEAVREWVESDVAPGADGRLAFHARVAVNALAMVERELAVGAAQAAAHEHRLAALGCADDAQLAERIRAGELDERLDEVRARIGEAVRAQREVANPRWLKPD